MLLNNNLLPGVDFLATKFWFCCDWCFAAIVDIDKMFHQVRLHLTDTDMLRFYGELTRRLFNVYAQNR